MQRIYLCIDLKSFYASVECVERGLDPMKTNLVVADPERSDKTICLAVSPAMKKLGVKNRCRVFETGNGRSDIIIFDNIRYEKGVVIEIKKADTPRELNQKCEEALKQIEDMNYDAELIEMGIEDIVKYGIAFHNKACRIKKA